MSTSGLTATTTTTVATTVPLGATAPTTSTPSSSSSAVNIGGGRKRPRDPNHLNDIFVDAGNVANTNQSEASGDGAFDVQRTDLHHGNLVFWILMDRLYQRHYEAPPFDEGTSPQIPQGVLDTIVEKVQQAVGVLEPHPGRFVFGVGSGVLVMESPAMIQSVIRRAVLAHHNGQPRTPKTATQKEALTVMVDHLDHKRHKSNNEKAAPTQVHQRAIPTQLNALAHQKPPPAKPPPQMPPHGTHVLPSTIPTQLNALAHQKPPPTKPPPQMPHGVTHGTQGPPQAPVITIPPHAAATLNEKTPQGATRGTQGPPPTQLLAPVITVPPQVTTTLNEKDVFWGGAFVNKYYNACYEGNRHFRALIESFGPLYDSAKRNHDEAMRQGIVAQIVLRIRSAGGRFLMEQAASPFSWMAVDDQVARLMTTNALETRKDRKEPEHQQKPLNGATTVPATLHLKRPKEEEVDGSKANGNNSSMSVAAAIAAIAKSQKLEEDDQEESFTVDVAHKVSVIGDGDSDDEVEYIATSLKESKMASSIPVVTCTSKAIVPGKNDVVVTRRRKDGGLSVDAELGDLEQEGNRLFLSVVEKSIQEKKQTVAMSVNAAVCSIRQLDPPGRFITYVPLAQQWQELDHAQVVSVVESALLAAAASALERLPQDATPPTSAAEQGQMPTEVEPGKNLPPLMVSCAEAARALVAPARRQSSEEEKAAIDSVDPTKNPAPAQASDGIGPPNPPPATEGKKVPSLQKEVGLDGKERPLRTTNINVTAKPNKPILPNGPIPPPPRTTNIVARATAKPNSKPHLKPILPNGPIAPRLQDQGNRQNPRLAIINNAVATAPVAPLPPKAVGMDQQKRVLPVAPAAVATSTHAAPSLQQQGVSVNQSNRPPAMLTTAVATRPTVAPLHRQKENPVLVPGQQPIVAGPPTVVHAGGAKESLVAAYRQQQETPVPMNQNFPSVMVNNAVSAKTTVGPAHRAVPVAGQNRPPVMNNAVAAKGPVALAPRQQDRFVVVNRKDPPQAIANNPVMANHPGAPTHRQQEGLVQNRENPPLTIAKHPGDPAHRQQEALDRMNRRDPPQVMNNIGTKHPGAPAHIQQAVYQLNRRDQSQAMVNNPGLAKHPGAPAHRQQGVYQTNRKDPPAMMVNNAVATLPPANRQHEGSVRTTQRDPPPAMLNSAVAARAPFRQQEVLLAPSRPKPQLMVNSVGAPYAGVSLPRHNGARVVAVPNANDVLFGGGVATLHHEGNLMFRRRIRNRLSLYAASGNHLKTIYVMEVMDLIRCFNPPGRFLEYYPKSGVWIEMEKDRIIHLTGLCFLDEARGSTDTLQHPGVSLGNQRRGVASEPERRLEQQRGVFGQVPRHHESTTVRHNASSYRAFHSTKPYTEATRIVQAPRTNERADRGHSEGPKMGATTVLPSVTTAASKATVPEKPVVEGKADGERLTSKREFGARVLEVEESDDHGKITVLWQHPDEVQKARPGEASGATTGESEDGLVHEDPVVDIARLEKGSDSSFLQESITFAVNRVRRPDLIPETCTTTEQVSVSELGNVMPTLSSHPRAVIAMIACRGLAAEHAHLGIAVQCRYCHPSDGRRLSEHGCHVVSTSNELLWGVLSLAWNHACCCNLVPPHMKAQMAATRFDFGKGEYVRDMCAIRRYCETVGTHFKLAESKQDWEGTNSAASIDLDGPDDETIARMKPVVSHISIGMRSALEMLSFSPLSEIKSKPTFNMRRQFQVCCRFCEKGKKEKSDSGPLKNDFSTTRSMFVVSKAEDLWPAVHSIIQFHVPSCMAISCARRLEVARLRHARTYSVDIKNLRRYCDACADVLFHPTRKGRAANGGGPTSSSSDAGASASRRSLGKSRNGRSKQKVPGKGGGEGASLKVPPSKESTREATAANGAGLQSVDAPHNGAQKPDLAVASRVLEVEWADKPLE